MSSQAKPPMPRRTFTKQFKESAAKLVTEQGYSLKKAAESLGVDRTSITSCVEKFGPQPVQVGTDAVADLRWENDRLRALNKRLLMRAQILEKATAFFAREQP